MIMLIQIFTFCKRILLDPLGYAALYLRKERATPQMRAYAMYVFFTLGTMKGSLQSIYKFFAWYPFFSQEIFIGLLPHTLLLSCFVVSVVCLLLSVSYISLYISYCFIQWIFTEALRQAGASASKERLHDLNIYLLAHVQLLGLPGSFVAILLSMVQVNGIAQFLALIVGVLGIAVFVRDLYVRYYVIQRVTDAAPFKAFLWNLAIWLSFSFMLVLLSGLFHSQLVGAFAH